MSVVLESRILRDFLHHLIDGLVDELERKAGPSARPLDARNAPHRIGTARPRIALEPAAQKAPTGKPAPPPRQQCPDVTISCRSSCSALEIAVNLAASIAQRLGLKPHGKATLDLHRGKLRVRCASGKGRAVYSGGPTGRLFFSVWADAFGVTKKHASEACTFQYDLEDALLIDPPAWLKRATASAPSAKQPTKDPKDVLPVSCKKLSGPTAPLKCAVCEKPTATLQCLRCQSCICDGCWETHVRTHWHADDKGKAATAARDARQAMRSEA